GFTSHITLAPDHFRNRIEVVIDRGIPESQHLESRSLKPVLAILITGFLADMAFPIQFDNQPRSSTVEVHDVSRKRGLPPELEASEATTTKFGPEPFFGRSHLPAQPTSTLRVKMILSHGSTTCPPHPRPLSPEGRGEKSVTAISGRRSRLFARRA